MSDEDSIDRVLRELGAAEAPEGMERRVRLALQQLPSQAGARGWWTERVWAVGVAATAVLLVVIVPVAMRRSTVANKPRAAAAMASGAPAGGESAKARVATDALKREKNGVEPDTTRHPAPSVISSVADRRVEGHVRGKAEVTARKGEMADASFAPSLVAPALPMTRQEQLLVRVVHQGDRAKVALLDARVRDAELVAEKADYDLFFKPPELPKQDQ